MIFYILNIVIDFFNNRVKDDNEKEDNENDDNGENNYMSMKISDFIQEESKFKKKNFLDDYLKKTDINYTISHTRVCVYLTLLPPFRGSRWILRFYD